MSSPFSGNLEDFCASWQDILCHPWERGWNCTRRPWTRISKCWPAVGEGRTMRRGAKGVLSLTTIPWPTATVSRPSYSQMQGPLDWNVDHASTGQHRRIATTLISALPPLFHGWHKGMGWDGWEATLLLSFKRVMERGWTLVIDTSRIDSFATLLIPLYNSLKHPLVLFYYFILTKRLPVQLLPGQLVQIPSAHLSI